MTDDAPASQRWRGRPVHSLLLQIFVFAIPVVASVAAATAVSAMLPRPETTLQFVLWWAGLTAIALIALAGVDRLARKLLPLATLLKLSMVFPDRAPSRFRVARNAASVRKLAEQLQAARERGLTAEPVWAAETVLTLITALGHHDRRSRGHSERVHVYAELLAEEMDLPQYDRDRLRWAALLHDVGKLVIPSDLLNKPAAPDEAEWDALRSHPKAGAELCAPLLPWLGEWGLAIAQHHEWFDGTGYPVGLSGLDISRAARIVAVADCYEVMTTSRTYKRALNPAAAREELAACAGTQFDPAIVRAFLNISLGRLRLAMGPLAILSTFPSMARLATLFEPLARAGAVMGGAAVILGGSTVLPSASATPPGLDVANADVVEIADAASGLESAAVAEHGLDDHNDGEWSSSNPPPPVADDARQVARQPNEERLAGDRTARGDRPRQTGSVGGPTFVAPRPAPPRDRDPSPAKPRPTRDPEPAAPPEPAKEPAPRPDRPPRPRPAGPPAGDLGANPTPPDSPPGQEDEKPDSPPANPTPPRSDRANGRDFN